MARAFLEGFCNDADMLDVVQRHDEPYTLWRQFSSKGLASPERLERLWKTIEDWDPTLAFLIINGFTAEKARASLK